MKYSYMWKFIGFGVLSVFIAGMLFPAFARAKSAENKISSASTPSLYQLTEAQVQELTKQPTLEDRMAELQPEKNLVNLQTAPLHTPGKALPVKNEVMTLTATETSSATQNGSMSIQSASTGSTVLDNGLNFLRNIQAVDGSWARYGEAGAITDTVAVSDLFQSFGLAADVSYGNALGWLRTKFTESTHLSSQVFSALAKSGENVNYSFEPVAWRLNDDGGFSYDRGYASDIAATASMLETITVSGYQDSGTNPDYTKISAIIFLLNSQNANGGWGEAPGDVSRTAPTAAALNALFPYRTMTIQGASSLVINDYIARGLAYLKNAQSMDGSWNGSLLETALAYDALHFYEAAPLNEDAAFQYLQSAQAADGSFGGGNPYVTAKTLKALSRRLLSNKPDLVITDITTSSTLVNYQPASFTITIKNIGRGIVSNAKLYDFTANYNWKPEGYDLGALGMNIGPNEQFSLTVSVPTSQFLGDTDFKFYVEGAGESNYENNWLNKNFTFAADAGGKPAVPVYYIAYKYDLNGVPALNIRWPQRPDANRSWYTAMFRKKGESQWNFTNISSNWNGAFISPFEEGATYEITMGVVHQDGSTVTYFSNSLTDVTMSANPSLYTGNAAGNLTFNEKAQPNTRILGYGVTATTDENGNYSLNNLANGTTAAWTELGQFDAIVTKSPVTIGGNTSGIRLFTRLADDTQAPNIVFFRIWDNYDKVIENTRDASIGLVATDNKNPKEADLSYFDPRINEWVYIKTVPVSGSWSSDTYTWNVSHDLIGSDFRLRAVVRDWKGNASAPVEWGPFQIVNGTNVSPTIKITEPDGINDQADATSTIKWDDSDPDSNALISLYYDTNNSGQDGTLITSSISEDSANNSYLWNTATVTPGTYYVYAKIADDGGNQAISYSSGTVTIAHAPVLAVPGAPSNLRTYNSHPTKVFMTWSAPTSAGDRPITGYRIERKLLSDPSFSVINSNTGTTTLLSIWDMELTASTTYQYRVRALSAAGESTPSNVAQITTRKPFAPGMYIYEEGYRAPWHDASSTQVSINPLYLSAPQNGAWSVNVNYFATTSDYSVSNPKGFNMLGSTAFTFGIRAATSTPTANFELSGYDPKGNFMQKVSLSAFIPDSRFVIGKWYTVNIPLASTTNAVISRLSFKSGNIGSYQFDTMGFLGNFPVPPSSLSMIEPNGIGDAADTFFDIRWNDVYEDGNATINLYYDNDQSGANGTLITSNISEDNERDTYTWRTTDMPAGTYYIYAVMSYPGGVITTYSPNPITISHSATPALYNIYRDSLGYGWAVTATTSLTMIASSENVAAGANAIKATYMPSGILEFTRATSSIETKTGKALKFSLLSTTAASSSAITLTAINANDVILSSTKSLTTYGSSTVQANTWYTYSIPLGDLAASNQLLRAIRFKASQALTLFLDEVRIE